jgi:hypothetical protein
MPALRHLRYWRRHLETQREGVGAVFALALLLFTGSGIARIIGCLGVFLFWFCIWPALAPGETADR